eukprot:6288160-Alexandrium_andersonii.AAC.1
MKFINRGWWVRHQLEAAHTWYPHKCPDVLRRTGYLQLQPLGVIVSARRAADRSSMACAGT